MQNIWKDSFCGCLPFASSPKNWERTVAFPVFLVWGELFTHSFFRRGQYRGGTVLINGFTGSGEVFWEKKIAPVSFEALPRKEYPNRFSLQQIIDFSEKLLKESGCAKGFSTHFGYSSPKVYPEKIKGCWRIYSWDNEAFVDLFSGKEELGFELFQNNGGLFP